MTTSSGGRMEFGLTFGKAQGRTAQAPPDICSALLLADFSGRANRKQSEPLAGRKRLPVTVDNQERAFAGLAAALELPAGGSAVPATHLRFESLDDFHPDQLVRRIESLAQLAEAKKSVGGPATAEDASRRLQALLGTGAPSQPAGDPTSASAPAASESLRESDRQTLTRLLGQAGAAAPSEKSAKPSSPVEGLVRQAVESSGAVVPAPPPGSEGLMASADLELAARLRAILHHRDVQALEAAWRAVDFLLRRCPDEDRIRYSLMDVTLEELSADPDGLRRLLRDSPPQWIVGHFTFGRSAADLDTLGKLAALCHDLGARFLGGAHPQLAGCAGFHLQPDPDDWHEALPQDVAKAWAAHRDSPHAASVALALPRFLLRQPYGAGSEAIESFAFEEIPDAGAHESFLWGNSAFLAAQVLAEAFLARAEGLEAEAGDEVDGLPLFYYREGGEPAMKPCAEAWLVDRAALALLRVGLAPVLSIKGRDAVRVVV